MALFEVSYHLHQLIRRTHFAFTGLAVAVSEKAIAGDRHLISQAPAKQLGDGDYMILTDKIEASKFYGGMELGAIVVETANGITDLKSERLKFERIMSDQVLPKPLKRGLGALP